MSEKIRFTTGQEFWKSDDTCRIPQPEPAKFHLPTWFKKIERHAPGKDGEKPNRTVKMCPPFLEAMVHGFVIKAPFDLTIHAQTNSSGNLEVKQAVADDIAADLPEKHLPITGFDVGAPLKPLVFYWDTFWKIETPPGYSCLCIEPLNRNNDEIPFRVLSQLVESDDCPESLQISVVPRVPFPLSIRRGAPLVQVIPFLREEWELESKVLTQEKIDSISQFREQYWSCENRQFEEWGDETDPEDGFGAYQKLVKAQTKFSNKSDLEGDSQT